MKAIAMLKLCVGGLLLSGCYTTTVSSGMPADSARIEYDEKWHHGVAWGMAELSGPHDLAEVCPHGWAEIRTETSFVNGVAEAVTSGIYAPQTVTVRCARPRAQPAALAPASKPAPAN